MSVWKSLLIPNPTIRELTTCAAVGVCVKLPHKFSRGHSSSEA